MLAPAPHSPVRTHRGAAREGRCCPSRLSGCAEPGPPGPRCGERPTAPCRTVSEYATFRGITMRHLPPRAAYYRPNYPSCVDAQLQASRSACAANTADLLITRHPTVLLDFRMIASFLLSGYGIFVSPRVADSPRKSPAVATTTQQTTHQAGDRCAGNAIVARDWPCRSNAAERARKTARMCTVRQP